MSSLPWPLRPTVGVVVLPLSVVVVSFFAIGPWSLPWVWSPGQRSGGRVLSSPRGIVVVVSISWPLLALVFSISVGSIFFVLSIRSFLLWVFVLPLSVSIIFLFSRLLLRFRVETARVFRNGFSSFSFHLLVSMVVFIFPFDVFASIFSLFRDVAVVAYLPLILVLPVSLILLVFLVWFCRSLVWTTFIVGRALLLLSLSFSWSRPILPPLLPLSLLLSISVRMHVSFSLS